MTDAQVNPLDPADPFPSDAQMNGLDRELTQAAQDLAERIVVWWQTVAEQDSQAAAAKSTEYGGRGAAIDLIWLGQQLADMGASSGWSGDGLVLTKQEVTELGIFFYLLGKLARWKAAILEGRKVSDDTIHDITVYAMMARYNRTFGSWP